MSSSATPVEPFCPCMMRYGGIPSCATFWCVMRKAAAHAADGYARVTGKPGVCMATSGPGATNLVTGIMGAKADSVPMVAITGQVARPVIGSEAFQECDICSIAAACTKMTYLVMSAQDLAPTIREAFRVAQEGRPGPVLIDVPRDVQLEEAEFEYPEEPFPRASPSNRV